MKLYFADAIQFKRLNYDVIRERDSNNLLDTYFKSNEVKKIVK